MLQRAATNGREISREDFYNIMTKKAFWFDPYYLQALLYQKSFKRMGFSLSSSYSVQILVDICFWGRK